MDKPESSSATTSKSQPSTSTKQHQHNRPPRREFQSKTHSVNKRPISKPFQRDCDVYVSNKSNFQVIFKILLIDETHVFHQKINLIEICSFIFWYLGSNETMPGAINIV